MHRVNFARVHGLIFDKAISGAIEAYLNNYERILQGEYNGNLFALLDETDPRRKLISEAKKLGRESIYLDPKKIEIEIGCYATFDTLLSEFCTAAINQAEVLSDGAGKSKLPWKSGHVMQFLGDHAPAAGNAPPQGWTSYQCLRRIIDFVCGMTDNYAVYVAKQLQGGGFSGGQRP